MGSDGSNFLSLGGVRKMGRSWIDETDDDIIEQHKIIGTIGFENDPNSQLDSWIVESNIKDGFIFSKNDSDWETVKSVTELLYNIIKVIIEKGKDFDTDRDAFEALIKASENLSKEFDFDGPAPTNNDPIGWEYRVDISKSYDTNVKTPIIITKSEELLIHYVAFNATYILQQFFARRLKTTKSHFSCR
ncbi:MAG: hypothetical protein IPP79_20735 [Chitinophagaceae bacterium]|nr:hypothetical protein [Chitinophagaceae bacterium]